jgi:hypothetical protein
MYVYQPPPQRPSDLKAKKISVRANKKALDIAENTAQEIFEAIEDELFEEGLLEFNEED